MLQIYRKCEKSLDNPYGIMEIEHPEDIDKPFLLCISSQDLIDKSVFGLIKEGARAARVRTSDEYAGGFKIEDVPAYFLGVKYKMNNIKDHKSGSLLNDFIYPFLTKTKDFKEIQKRARMMNFFTYCNATNVYVELEKGLKEKLNKDGFSEKEIDEILSQVSLISIASEVDVSKLSATTVLFKDANDREVYDFISKTALKKMEQIARDAIIGNLKSNGNVLTYVYNGTGDHELKEYLKDVNIVKSSLCAVVSKLLDNSIKNMDEEELIPIDGKEVLKTLIRYNGEFQGTDIYLKRIDDEIDYKGCKKYTKSEHDLLCKLDQAYKQQLKTKQQLENETKQNQDLKEKVNLLITGVKEKCSDVAFEQIVTQNHMWNPSKDSASLLAMKTDREIREEYEKLIEENQMIR